MAESTKPTAELAASMSLLELLKLIQHQHDAEEYNLQWEAEQRAAKLAHDGVALNEDLLTDIDGRATTERPLYPQSLGGRPLTKKEKAALLKVAGDKLTRDDLRDFGGAPRLEVAPIFWLIGEYVGLAKRQLASERQKAGDNGKPTIIEFVTKRLLGRFPLPVPDDELRDDEKRLRLDAFFATDKRLARLAELDERGYTTQLLAEVWNEYPDQAAEMKLPLPPSKPAASGSSGANADQSHEQLVTLQQAAASAPNDKPVSYCFGWAQIVDAIGLKNDQETRNRIRRLNQEHGGPILVEGQGAQPKVNFEKLILWWNGLESRFEELRDKQRDRHATIAATYQHGKDAVVVPDIRGSVKRRRKGKT